MVSVACVRACMCVGGDGTNKFGISTLLVDLYLQKPGPGAPSDLEL